jgi:hypothetical protein
MAVLARKVVGMAVLLESKRDAVAKNTQESAKPPASMDRFRVRLASVALLAHPDVQRYSPASASGRCRVRGKDCVHLNRSTRRFFVDELFLPE